MAMGERQPVRRRLRLKAEVKAKAARNDRDGLSFLNVIPSP
jgi:hypothetical protein